MSISINSTQYSNAVNAYSGNQKADSEKSPTLEQLQETVGNSKMDTFTLIPIDLIPDGNADLNQTDSTRDIYYSELFSNGAEYADTILARGIYNVDMTSWIEANRALLDTGVGTVEGCTARYAQLREEVIKTFELDRDSLTKNLQSLDKAFELALKNVARNAIVDIEPPHKLAAAKGFNQQELFAHTQDMMSKFALNFIGQIRSGIGQAAAYNNTLSLMNSMFAVTTSVNKLSFNDFSLLGKYMLMDVGGRNYTAAGNIAKQNVRTEAFNNSTELSAELRALLG